jgi:amidase
VKTLKRSELAYVIGAQKPPALVVEQGEVFLVETEDAFNGTFLGPEDLVPEKIGRSGVGFSNPVTGPVYVNGALPGDALVIKVHEMRCASRGATRVRPGMGVLSTFVDAPVVYFIDIKDGHAHLPGGARVPLAPMIGTIGVAPAHEAIATGRPGPYGGNLDVRDIGPGCDLILPVYVPGALLYLGDVHATQGDGEFTGAAVEVRAEVVLSATVVRPAPKTLVGPRVRQGGRISTLASDKPLDDAVRASAAAMVNWLAEDYGFDRMAAYQFITNCGFGRVCQMVNPLYTAACTVEEPPARR